MVNEMEVYGFGVKRDDVFYDPMPDVDDRPLEMQKKTIDGIVQEYVEKLGLDSYNDGSGNPISYKNTYLLPNPERNHLNDELRKDDRMLELVLEIFKECGEGVAKIYDFDPKKLINTVGKLDWNSNSVTKMDEAIYTAVDKEHDYQSSLLIKGLGFGHTYVTQSTRDNPDVPAGTFDSPSISGFVLSNDHPPSTLVGYRGGGHLDNTGMTVPAGSVDINLENPVFDSFYKEFDEELFDSDCLKDAEIIGKIYDPYVGGNSLFVFRSQTDMGFDEIHKKWRESHVEDKFEHKDLIPVPVTQSGLMENLEEHDIPYGKDRPEVGNEELPYLYPLKQSLAVLGKSIDADFDYDIKYKM